MKIIRKAFEDEIFKIVCISIIMAIIFSVIIIGGSGYAYYRYDLHKWNNGRCLCGGKWEYSQPMSCRSEIMFLYKCDNCGRVEYFHEWRLEIKN